ncbi:hypothetical protein V6N13_037580 [Hibiscus sabdariffa]
MRRTSRMTNSKLSMNPMKNDDDDGEVVAEFPNPLISFDVFRALNLACLNVSPPWSSSRILSDLFCMFRPQSNLTFM